MTLSSWVEKYGKIAAYTSAVVILTTFLIRFDGKFSDGNKQLTELNTRVNTLGDKVEALTSLLQDREKYDRWRRQYNARIKRLFLREGWEYDEVE